MTPSRGNFIDTITCVISRQPVAAAAAGAVPRAPTATRLSALRVVSVAPLRGLSWVAVAIFLLSTELSIHLLAAADPAATDRQYSISARKARISSRSCEATAFCSLV